MVIQEMTLELNTENSIHVLNAPSPAATAALAIGNDIKKMAVERFGVN